MEERYLRAREVRENTERDVVRNAEPSLTNQTPRKELISKMHSASGLIKQVINCFENNSEVFMYNFSPLFNQISDFMDTFKSINSDCNNENIEKSIAAFESLIKDVQNCLLEMQSKIDENRVAFYSSQNGRRN